MHILTEFLKYCKYKIFKIVFYLLVGFVMCFMAQSCAKALTISDNYRLGSDTYINYLTNVAKSSNYKNYLITYKYESTSGYNTINNYYLCLTNEDINVIDTLNSSTTCGELLTYKYQGSDYTITTQANESLSIVNSIYYLKDKDTFDFKILLISILIILSISLMVTITFRILRNRYGGLSYGKIT